MLFPEIRDKRRIEKIRTEEFYQPMLLQAEKALRKTWEISDEGLTYREFSEYFKTGSRKEYERKYFGLYRMRLAMSAVLYIIYESKEYLDILIETMWSVCNEYTWALPNHTENEACEEDIVTFIDLFAAETGQALSEIVYAVGDRLPPMLVSRVKFELERRIFVPYSRRRFWWEKSPTNWAAVCGAAVGMMYLYVKPDEFPAVQDRILKTMDSFLSGYSREGACLEGLSYWNYGFGYYIFFAQLLYEATGGKADIVHQEFIKKIAMFQQKMYLYKNDIVTFSDCPNETKVWPGLSCFLNRTFAEVTVPGRENWEELGEDFCARFAAAARALFWTEPLAEKPVCRQGEEYLPGAQWYFYRGREFGFAAKAGHNEEPHNQNDVGSFLLSDAGGRILIDYGSGEYTNQYFMRRTRYLDLCNSSRGHSVPEIDGIAQSDGRSHGAEVLCACCGVFRFEMAQAYGHDTLESLIREFRVSEKEIILEDHYNFADCQVHSIIERFVTMKEPKITEQGVRIGRVLLVSNWVAQISAGVVKNHFTYQPETLFFIEYQGGNQNFVLKIILDIQ